MTQRAMSDALKDWEECELNPNPKRIWQAISECRTNGRREI